MNNQNNLNPKRLSVAYLLENQSEIPEGLEKFFRKLKSYEESMKEIIYAGQQAEKTLQELGSKRDQLFGSINSVTELIVDELPDDKCMEWAGKAEAILKRMSSSSSKNSEEIDLAGSTSKQGSIPPLEK